MTPIILDSENPQEFAGELKRNVADRRKTQIPDISDIVHIAYLAFNLWYKLS